MPFCTISDKSQNDYEILVLLAYTYNVSTNREFHNWIDHWLGIWNMKHFKDSMKKCPHVYKIGRQDFGKNF